MKIVYYSPHPNLTLNTPSGPGTHMREVISAFEAQGHTVVQFVVGDRHHSSLSESSFKIPWYKRCLKFITPEIVWQSLKDWDLVRIDKRNERELEALVKLHKPDLIYERAYYLMLSGARVSKKCNISLFIEMNAPYSEEKIYLEGNSLYIRRSKVCEREQLESAEAVFVVSSALSQYFKAQYPACENKIVITPNAINSEKAHANPALKASLKAQYRISNDQIVIGFVGSIFRYHGVDHLIYAFSKLCLKLPEKSFRLLIVGDGIVLRELKRQAKDLNLSKKIIFVGNVPHREVYSYIDLMDIAVMARSNWYGSPVKVFEYGAMSKAIIAPDNVPMRDVMVNEIEGVLVGEGPDEVLEALERLVLDATLRHRLASAFHQKVEREYTWDKVVQKILSKSYSI